MSFRFCAAFSIRAISAMRYVDSISRFTEIGLPVQTCGVCILMQIDIGVARLTL